MEGCQPIKRLKDKKKKRGKIPFQTLGCAILQKSHLFPKFYFPVL
jgi:hypothetical protein